MFGLGSHWIRVALDRLEMEEAERQARIAAVEAAISATLDGHREARARHLSARTFGTAGLTASELEEAMVESGRAAMDGARGPDWQGRAPGYTVVSGDPADWRDPPPPEPLPVSLVDERRKRALARIEEHLRTAHERRLCNIMLAAGPLQVDLPETPDFARDAAELLDIGIIEAGLTMALERFS